MPGWQYARPSVRIWIQILIRIIIGVSLGERMKEYTAERRDAIWWPCDSEHNQIQVLIPILIQIQIQVLIPILILILILIQIEILSHLIGNLTESTHSRSGVTRDGMGRTAVGKRRG